MRGETSPAPIYEGEDGVIAWLLDGPDAVYRVPLPEPGEPKRAILDTYTKEHSAEYQAQAFIDLARRLRQRLADLARVRSVTILTSHHTHYVIGTGSGDPQKFDPDASRETLDHSLPYIFAVALEDGTWEHSSSYLAGKGSPARDRGPVGQGHDGRGPLVDGAVPGRRGLRGPGRGRDWRTAPLWRTRSPWPTLILGVPGPSGTPPTWTSSAGWRRARSPRTNSSASWTWSSGSRR